MLRSKRKLTTSVEVDDSIGPAKTNIRKNESPATVIPDICFRDATTNSNDEVLHHFLPFLDVSTAQCSSISTLHTSLWSQNYAAQMAANYQYPSNICRFLGTITRKLEAEDAPPKVKWSSPLTSEKKRRNRPKVLKISISQAKKAAVLELNTTTCSSVTKEEVEERALFIKQQWEGMSKCNLNFPLWDTTYGHLEQIDGDENYIPLQSLRKWKFRDVGPQQKKMALYDGLRTIDIDTNAVLNSLASLQSPKSLYNIPLVIAYPRLQRIDSNDHLHYRLTIGIYSHRLLPEVMTQIDLHRVMSALDKGSYCLTQSLCIPPVPSKPTFCSSVYPKLDYADQDIDVDNNSDEEDDNMVIDLTIEESTRTSTDTVSAFSVAGLMKMWENTGNDVAEWPQIQPKLSKYVKLDLLLHQKHAICWMLQMESLGGFGINSILWEERAWIDGIGKYYYSPALGQIRLQKPPTMRGGILADEMGLGKTIMVLGLIATTLEEMKNEKDTDRLHTTLIVVPPALCTQWQNEIQKATNGTIITQFYDALSNKFIPDYDFIPDIVVTTYHALNKKSLLQEYKWGRIVLDEMQEVRSSTSKISKSCDKLDCQRRWMISGTPLFEGIEDLKGELNFLSLEPFAAKLEDGFFDYNIINHWKAHSHHGLETLKILGLLLLRRSKSMTIAHTNAPLMGLPPLTVEYIPVSQSPWERALYCYLEHIVSFELANETSGASRKHCLRLLRELCISPILLSGGLGVASEMSQLQNLMVRYNRRKIDLTTMDAELENGSNDHRRIMMSISGRACRRTKSVMSCHEAIRYLSQLQEEVRTDEAFVSGLQLSAGGGMAKRVRAVEPLEERRQNCRSKLQNAKKQIKIWQSTRAKARWHLAMEKISTGAIIVKCRDIKPSVAALWRWRAVIAKRIITLKRESDFAVSRCFLLRGWRPSQEWINAGLHKAHPGFAWAYPFALALHNIPRNVNKNEIEFAIYRALKEQCSKINVVAISSCNNNNVGWKAIVHFQNSDDAKLFGQKGRRGFSVSTKAHIPFLEEETQKATATLEEAKNQHNVYPTVMSKRKLKESQNALLAMKNKGLQITMDEDSSHILLSRAKNAPRSLNPPTSQSLYNQLCDSIQVAKDKIATTLPICEEQTKMLKNLDKFSGVPEEIQSMSAFESLEALSMKDYKKTNCAICLGTLGSTFWGVLSEGHQGMVGLTVCGHLFCYECIKKYTDSTSNPKCPTCRKDLAFDNTDTSKIFPVDPCLSQNEERLEVKKRTRAKQIIKKAAAMLENSNGQLDPEMWLQLYLSIDLPRHVLQRGDPHLSAIPREVIQHFRAATGMDKVHCKPQAVPNQGIISKGLATKIQALLRDLPRDERCVVFTCHRPVVKHLQTVFQYQQITYRTLFSGQNIVESEKAMEEWQSTTVDEMGNTTLSARVLLVQAGTAACGLTLTSACKMFLMEPFVRQEEEQQAFARCHRYGQVHPVHVKCYFTPVSVESRLLKWRKLDGATQNSSLENTKILYTDIMDTYAENDDENNEECDRNDADENEDQTMFLLGLK